MRSMNPDYQPGFTRFNSEDAKQERKLQRELQMKRNLQASKWRRERNGIKSRNVSKIDVCYVMYKMDPAERAACIKRLNTYRP